jgi:excisionase family DNA binding protein
VAKESIYRWIEARGLPAHRVGRLLRFRLSEIDTWVKDGGGESKIEVSNKSVTSKISNSITNRRQKDDR